MSQILSSSSSSARSSDETVYYPVMEKDKDILGRVLLFMFDNWSLKTAVSCDSSHLKLSAKPGSKKIFSIDPACGVNFEKTLFEIQLGDYHLQYRIVSDRVGEYHRNYYKEIRRSQRVCFLNSSLSVFVGARENEKKVTFIISLCNCGGCRNPLKRWPQTSGESAIDFDLMTLKPVDIDLQMSHAEEEQVLTLTFQPGVIDQFDMNKEAEVSDSGFSTVVYQSSVSLSSLTIFPFKDFYKRIEDARTRCRPVLTSSEITEKSKNTGWSIKITRIEPTPQLMTLVDSKEKRTFNAIFENREHSDLKVISEDGKEFPCNKVVLVVRSTVFQSMLTEQRFVEGKEGKVHLSEDAAATGALLKWIYFQDIGWESLDFKASIGTLKLAHLHGIMELVGSASRNLLRKLAGSTWEDVSDILDLYDFVRKINTIQIVVRLKSTTILTFLRIMKNKRSKHIRLDDDDVKSTLISAFENNPDLTMELFMDGFQFLTPENK